MASLSWLLLVYLTASAINASSVAVRHRRDRLVVLEDVGIRHYEENNMA
jgi:hypothetical protein